MSVAKVNLPHDQNVSDKNIRAIEDCLLHNKLNAYQNNWATCLKRRQNLIKIALGEQASVRDLSDAKSEKDISLRGKGFYF